MMTNLLPRSTTTLKRSSVRTAAAAIALAVGVSGALPVAAGASSSRTAAKARHTSSHGVVGGHIRGRQHEYSVKRMLAATPLEVGLRPGGSPSVSTRRRPRYSKHLGLLRVVAPVASRDQTSAAPAAHLGGWSDDSCVWDPDAFGCDTGGGYDPAPDPTQVPNPAPHPAPAPDPVPDVGIDTRRTGRITWGTDLSNTATRTEGRIFFTAGSDGKTHSCSGTVVASENQSVVWTAGHCVHGGAGSDFHTDFVFVPAYDSGVAPYGQFTARERWTTGPWSTQGGQHGPFTDDFGTLVLNLNDSGQTVVQAVNGAQGITFNQPTNQSFVGLGYPADAPFDGSTLFACLGSPTQLEFASDGVTPLEMGLPCDMTGGASGGGWIIGMDSQGLGYVNSANSYGPSDHTMMWGAYQGAAAQSLYNTVQAN